ncbi:MAG: tetratricopeptide repeat protein, partial [Candidatus Thorarchaeota archaeon]
PSSDSRATTSPTYESDLQIRVTAFPSDAQSWFLLGCHLRLESRPAEAERALRKALSLEPERVHYWIEFALVLDDLGHKEESADILHHFRQSMKSGPSDSVVASLEATRSIDESLNGAPDDTALCVSCSDFTFYGCRRSEPCDRLTPRFSGSSD